MGNLLNNLIEKAVTRWITSDAAKNYVASSVKSWGKAALVYVLLRYGAKYGLTQGAMDAITGHWDAILTFVAPAIGVAVIEFASWAKAKLNAKALEVAAAAPANALTPAMAKEVAKVALADAKAAA